MEFIPQTLEALDELDPLLDDGRLAHHLIRTAERAQAIAPDLAGLSLAYRSHGLTFTLVATDHEIATFDAVQYLDTGPCVEALEHGRGVATTGDGLLDEDRWHALAVVTAAAGVRSTLTFPIRSAGRTVGTVNLYGRSPRSFVGKHQDLADVLNAWASEAVTNADLEFSTRDEARLAPDRVRGVVVVDTAAGILASRRSVTVDEARGQLGDAASRAGVPVAELARVVIGLHHS